MCHHQTIHISSHGVKEKGRGGEEGQTYELLDEDAFSTKAWRIIVVFRTVHPILGDVQVHTIIPRFRDLHSVFFKGLIFKLHGQLDS